MAEALQRILEYVANTESLGHAISRPSASRGSILFVYTGEASLIGLHVESTHFQTPA
jgi:hypothetical protein